LKEEFRADRDLWEPLDKCLYHLFTSSKYFRQETHTLIIKLVKELGVEVMVDSVATRLYREGEAIGEARGEARGEAIGKAKSIIRFLRNRVGMPSVELQEKIKSIRSTDKLDELLDFASTCVSLGEFETAFN
jgi:DNA-binding protein